MPWHYAITDALVALMGGFAAWTLVRASRPLAALGMGLFGLAGLIGTVRITSGLIEPLAALHVTASQLGGVAGLTLLVLDMPLPRRHLHSGLRLLLAAAAAGVAVLSPMAGAAVFVALLCAAILMCLKARTMAVAAAHLLMLLNITLVRRSADLGPDLSWHLYHLIVAIWLGAMLAAEAPVRRAGLR
jgi:hypothetical protein